MITPQSTGLLADRYRIGELLGVGGMAEVHDGWDERLHRPVAVKRLRPEMAAHADVRSRFAVEGRAAAQLSHPNVVAVFDTGDHDGAPFLVMERLPGETLADKMAAGPLHEADVHRLALEILAALGAAHAAGIIHRDIKPANILLTADGSAKVADFGIAKSAEVVAGDPTTAGVLLGTPAYLAPERVGGQAATAQSDLYAVGVVLYEALAGAKPFRAATPLAMAAAIQTETPPPLALARPGVSPSLGAAVDAAMARNPADRPPSAAAMSARLQSGADHTVGAVAPAMAPDPTMRLPAVRQLPGLAARARRAPLWPVVAGVGLLVALLVAASLGGGPTPVAGDASRAESLKELAERVEVGDGPQGPQAAVRLRALAELVAAGGGAAEARSLATDAAGWLARGELSPVAATEIVSLLGRLPGVDPPAPVTTVATVPPPTSVVPAAPDNDRDERRGRSKRGDQDD